jgi:hypothetical protein
MRVTTRQKRGQIRTGNGSSFLFLLAPLVRSLLNTRRKILLFAVLCVLLASLTLFVVKSGYFSTVWNHVRDIHAQDRIFLDDLIQKHKQQAVLDTDPMVATQNIRKTSMIGSGNDPAPKAELVVNSAMVKRAELVVHSSTVKRPGLVRRRH